MIEFRKGESIYEAFDDPGGIIGMTEGLVALHLPERGSKNTLGHIGGPGYWTGDISALTGRERTISIIARTDCKILKLSRAEMQRLGDRDPISWRYFSEIAGRNLAQAIYVIEALKHMVPAQRVAMTILNLNRDLGPFGNVVPLSQSEFSAAADLSRSSVNAAMTVLKNRHFVKVEYGGVEVLDIEKLSQFAYQD
ncbi:MAG: Crp/Fnr family transcriptional regulator [Paracoccaceae bacterium]